MNRFIGCNYGIEEADIVIFGAPFDGTTSFRPGARFAPGVMRADSWGLETYSPYRDKDLDDLRICDGGDLELPFGNAERALGIIEEYTAGVVGAGKKPVMIGGEHLVTLGAFRAVHKLFNDVCVVHFDAHTDLRDDYLGEQLSHACVMRRVHDIVGDNRIWQFGIRSGEKREFEFAELTGFINKFNLDGIDKTVEAIKGRPVYVTVDLDVLDPSVMPGTGTPEPGGVSFELLCDAVVKLSKLNVVAFDIVELAPNYDHSGISAAVACKLLREMVLAYG